MAQCVRDDITERRCRRGAGARCLGCERHCRSRICSSAPAANAASAISCCGISLTRSSIFTDKLWPDFDVAELECGAGLFRRARAALRPHGQSAARRSGPRLSPPQYHGRGHQEAGHHGCRAGRRSCWPSCCGCRPPATVVALTLVVLAGAWEWSAFLRVAASRCALIYVLVIAALLPLGVAFHCRRRTGRDLVLRIAVAWWLIALGVGHVRAASGFVVGRRGRGRSRAGACLDGARTACGWISTRAPSGCCSP